MLRTARAASFLAATSLFLLQPLVARALVPLYGGTSWVWIAVSVFFQLALIAGYVSAATLGVKRRARLHAVVAMTAFVFAAAGLWLLLRRVALDAMPTEPAVFVHLLASAGAIAVYLAMASPLLQISVESDGRIDAHRLYAWSNAGSLLGLVVYPTVMESFVPLRYQMAIWLTLAAAAAYLIHRTVVFTEAAARPQHIEWHFPGRGRVVFIAAVAGALTIAVTTRLTLDMGALPLLWVLPLIMLLLSYIVAFGRLRAQRILATASPVAVAMACYLFFASNYIAAFELVVLWCGLLFIIQCGLQTQLRALAPTGAARGAYYVSLASGGFAGSLVVGCLVPSLWDTASRLASAIPAAHVLTPMMVSDTTPELGWCLIAASFAVIPTEPWRRRDLAVAAMVSSSAALLVGTGALEDWNLLSAAAFVGGALAIAYLPAVAGRPRMFALAITALVIAVSFVPSSYSRELFRTRNIYGVLVARATAGGFTQLHHGSTLHGSQESVVTAAGDTVPSEPRTPLSYYHRKSPIGLVFNAVGRTGCPLHIGIVGLGAGTLAAYARAGDHFEFYEIDPGVITAADSRHFSYLSDARARGARITITEGDGRRTLERRTGPKLDLIVVDAFSSDSIPAHLLTLEAFEALWRQLTPGGHLMFHVSNRYFDVYKVVAANATRLGWRHSLEVGQMDTVETSRSVWVLVRPTGTAMSGGCAVDLFANAPPTVNVDGPVWTDDFSSPLRLLQTQGLWEKLTGQAGVSPAAGFSGRPKSQGP